MKMKKTRIMMIVTMIALISLVVFSSQWNLSRANPDYSIVGVRHQIGFLGDGDLFINDTIQIEGSTNTFLVGFPVMFGQQLLKAVAFDTLTKSELNVTTNVPLEDRIGFYGVNVSSSQGIPQIFTVGFILDNTLISQNAQNNSLYTVNFPAFPSLTKNADICNASILAPEGTEVIATLEGSVNTLDYSAVNLTAFAFYPAQVTLGFPSPSLQIFNLNTVTRAIQINELGGVAVSDTYSITNQAAIDMTSFQATVVANATNVVAEDELGRTLAAPQVVDATQGFYNVSLTNPLSNGNSTTFTLSYSLPKSEYNVENSPDSFTFSLPVFQNVNYYVTNAKATVNLPEGASLKSEADLVNMGFVVSRSVFQEQVGLNTQGLSPFDTFSMQLSYNYDPLWASFRPTLWVWALAVVVGIIGMAWVAPKPKVAEVGVSAPSITMRFSQDELKSFVDSYDEKRKIEFEIESLEERVQKGRIPRRRYKVQKRTLETRLESISRSSNEFKEKMRAAGGQNAELVVQLEVAEAELDEIANSIRNAETLHRRGDLTLEVYRKRMEDFDRRKEKANNAISGILLRLREEMR